MALELAPKVNTYLEFPPAKRANPILLVAFWRVPSKALREAHTGAVICIYNVQLAIEFDPMYGTHMRSDEVA